MHLYYSLGSQGFIVFLNSSHVWTCIVIHVHKKGQQWIVDCSFDKLWQHLGNVLDLGTWERLSWDSLSGWQRGASLPFNRDSSTASTCSFCVWYPLWTGSTVSSCGSWSRMSQVSIAVKAFYLLLVIKLEGGDWRWRLLLQVTRGWGSSFSVLSTTGGWLLNNLSAPNTTHLLFFLFSVLYCPFKTIH